MNVLRRAANATALIDLRPGQCLMMAEEDMVPIVNPAIWLDNLYLRISPPTKDRAFVSVGLLSIPRMSWQFDEPGEAVRFVTRCTLQGDGLGPSVGVWVNEDTYIERTPPSLRPGSQDGPWFQDALNAGHL